MVDQDTHLAEVETHLDLSNLLDTRTQDYQDALRLTPATMAYYRTQGRWKPARHLLYIASEVAHEISKGNARIIIEIHPRSGKSELISVHTPIWFLDKFPEQNVILTTYASDLSTRFGRRVRDAFIEDDGGFLRAKIREDVQRTDVFQTSQGGGMMSVGIGGAITGFGANLLLVDDYVKNFTEAMSEVTNAATWDWFRSTAYTRLEPGASVIVLATRWGINDLIGHIIKAEPGVWRRLRLPALAEAEGDPLGRTEGQALWPERYDEKRLLAIKSFIGTYLFNSMYQQNPQKAEDNTCDVSMIRKVDSIPNAQLVRWVRSWDFAATKTRKSDWTVGSLVGTDGEPGSTLATTYIGDMVRDQLKPAQVETLVRKTAEADGASVPIVIEQEPGAAGKAQAEHFATSVLRGFIVVIRPSAAGNKIAKANPYVAAVSHGRVVWLRASWNKAHEDELTEWPAPPHDDTVDATAGGYNHLHQSQLLVPTWGRAPTTLTAGNQSRGIKLVTGCVFGRSQQG